MDALIDLDQALTYRDKKIEDLQADLVAMTSQRYQADAKLLSILDAVNGVSLHLRICGDRLASAHAVFQGDIQNSLFGLSTLTFGTGEQDDPGT